jgi:hypothetical protein
LTFSWYFVNGPGYLSESRIKESFVGAIKTSFKSDCLTGFLLAVMETLKVVADIKI